MSLPDPSRSSTLLSRLSGEIELNGLVDAFSARYDSAADAIVLQRRLADGTNRETHYPAEEGSLATILQFLRIQGRLATLRGTRRDA